MTETTTTEPQAANKPADASPNPNHDRYSASVYRAMALRFHARYIDMRRQAEFRGCDLEGHPPLITAREASERYLRAVDDFLEEEVTTSDAALSLVEFAAVIAADRIMDEAIRETGPGGDELNAYHQAIVLANAGRWLNEVAVKDWLELRKQSALAEIAGKRGAA